MITLTWNRASNLKFSPTLLRDMLSFSLQTTNLRHSFVATTLLHLSGNPRITGSQTLLVEVSEERRVGKTNAYWFDAAANGCRGEVLEPQSMLERESCPVIHLVASWSSETLPSVRSWILFAESSVIISESLSPIVDHSWVRRRPNLLRSMTEFQDPTDIPQPPTNMQQTSNLSRVNSGSGSGNRFKFSFRQKKKKDDKEDALMKPVVESLSSLSLLRWAEALSFE